MADVYLLAGVSLPCLGKISKDTEEIPLVSPLGKKTGKKATLINVWLTVPNGKRFLIGSNDEEISCDWCDWPENPVESYHYGCLFGYDRESLEMGGEAWDDYVAWVHSCNLDRPEDTVIGLCLSRGTDLACIQESEEEVRSKVENELLRRFGYTGKINVFAMSTT